MRYIYLMNREYIKKFYLDELRSCIVNYVKLEGKSRSFRLMALKVNQNISSYIIAFNSSCKFLFLIIRYDVFNPFSLIIHGCDDWISFHDKDAFKESFKKFKVKCKLDDDNYEDLIRNPDIQSNFKDIEL